MTKKFKNMKIRTQLTYLILIAGIISYSLFQILWLNKWTIYKKVDQVIDLTPPHGDPYFLDTLRTEAVNYDIPKSEDDTKSIQKLEPFFALSDPYTSMYIYGLEDGIFRAGKYAEVMDNNTFRAVFDLGYQVSGGVGEMYREFPIEFKNGTALVMIYFYHNVLFLYPYGIFCIVISILTFLTIILCFISRKMKQVVQIKNGILQMSSGDLKTPLPRYGSDEIGILSSELDKLRVTLEDTLRQEQESRQANQDLITAMSHDLRTPLTILSGYLDVLKLKKTPDKEAEYLDRCLQKTKDIKEMTDRMFEYALVFEESEVPNIKPVSLSFAQDCILENCDFIHLAGFQFCLDFPPEDFSLLTFAGDETMLKRIFNNLFSNILKYGEKSEPVQILIRIESDELRIQIHNTIQETHSEIESNHIGLKSVEKMMTLLGGRMLYSEKESQFTVQLTFSAAS